MRLTLWALMIDKKKRRLSGACIISILSSRGKEEMLHQRLRVLYHVCVC